MKRPHLAREIIEILVLTLVIFLVVRYVIQSYHTGANMQPSLTADEQVIVNKIAYRFHSPERGDVIVFHDPHDVGQSFIERIIGLPGDTIKEDSTTITLNGKVLHESYVNSPTNPTAMSVTVPANEYFVADDNRVAQDDSRYPDFGFVPRAYIVGKAVMVFWPLNKLQFIDSHADVFTQTGTNSQPTAIPATPHATTTPGQQNQKKK